MNVLKCILFIGILGLVSCEVDSIENNLQQEDLSIIDKDISQNVGQRAIQGWMRRASIKKKATSGYRSTIITDNQGANPTDLLVSLEGENGKTEFIIKPKAETQEEKPVRYVYTLEEGLFEEGIPLKVDAIMITEDGATTGTADSEWATPQDNDGVDINNVFVKQSQRPNYFRLGVNLGGQELARVAELFLEIEGVEGSFPLSESSDGDNKRWRLQEIIERVKSTVQTEDLLAITVISLDEAGEVIDNEVHNVLVTALEQEEGITPEPIVVKLKNNGNGFNIRQVVKGTERVLVSEIAITFDESYDDIAPVETDFTLKFVKESTTAHTYANGMLQFENPQEAVGSTHLITLDYLAIDGSVLLTEELEVTIQSNN